MFLSTRAMLFLMFTGQGSQITGMGQDFFMSSLIAREVMETIEEMLKYDLRGAMFDTDNFDLRNTKTAQPAIFTFEMMVWKFLKGHFGAKFLDTIKLGAGHSVGEYAALVSSNTIELEDGIKILDQRAKFMEQCSKSGVGGMVALLGGTFEAADIMIKAMRADDAICEIANDNSMAQTIISGHSVAMTKVLDNYKNYNFKKAVKLEVSGAFHSSLMIQAADNFAKFMEDFEFQIGEAGFPIISNVYADYYPKDEHAIREILTLQIKSPVRWRETISKAYEAGFRTFVEIGPSPVLSNLARRDFPDITAISVCRMEDIDKLEPLFV